MKINLYCFLISFFLCFSNKIGTNNPIKSNILLIANGSFEKEVVDQFKAMGVTIIALDGAANTLKDQGIQPDIILGDLDSIDKSEVLSYFLSQGVKLIEAPNQDGTDLSKGISYCCDQLKAKNIYITCALRGSRTDHSFENLSLLKKHYNPSIKMYIINPTDIIQFVRDEKITFTAVLGEKLGLFGFPSATAISSPGSLKWPLTKEYKLELGEKSSACNIITASEVTLSIKGDALLVRPLKGAKF